ncbi:MAG: metallophosphoesterase [Prevotellaceae bacterium]|jgi:predicted phosphohydrolase|nr:metallophosphoesterase [Prevotellaceae bacterium]
MLIKFKNLSGEEHQLFAFADTHGNHRQIIVPDDVETVIFAGDACEAGDQNQLEDFFAWFSALPAKNKLFVPGNHDLPFEFAPDFAKSMVPENVIFLENESVTLNGIRFYSLPVRPWMHAPLYLPSGVDVLVTHGAPQGILDKGFGCTILRHLVDLAKPEIHLFGHLHFSGRQWMQEGETQFYNVAVGA